MHIHHNVNTLFIFCQEFFRNFRLTDSTNRAVYLIYKICEQTARAPYRPITRAVRLLKTEKSTKADCAWMRRILYLRIKTAKNIDSERIIYYTVYALYCANSDEVTNGGQRSHSRQRRHRDTQSIVRRRSVRLRHDKSDKCEKRRLANQAAHTLCVSETARKTGLHFVVLGCVRIKRRQAQVLHAYRQRTRSLRHVQKRVRAHARFVRQSYNRRRYHPAYRQFFRRGGRVLRRTQAPFPSASQNKARRTDRSCFRVELRSSRTRRRGRRAGYALARRH